MLRPGATAVAAAGVPAGNVPATAPEVKVAARTYKVQKGDTPYAIARKQGVKVAELLQHNGIKDPSGLKPGQTIRIPVRK